MKLLKMFSIITLLVSVLSAEPIDVTSNKDGYDISFKSKKPLVVGENDFVVSLSKNGKNITDAKVKVKFFMPEMPGMPYMEYIGKGENIDGKYKILINFSMGGTWQYHLMFKTADGKIHKIRSSVNL